jgi:hypothetical protein
MVRTTASPRPPDPSSFSLLAACGREWLEGGTDGSCGEAGTGIVHDQQNRPVRPAGRYVDPAACRGVADGVVNQVVDGLPEPDRIDPGPGLPLR